MSGGIEGGDERTDLERSLVNQVITPAHALAGVVDDPEGTRVLAECADAWASLPARARDRVRLVTLQMEDVELNALTVNAAQRHAQQ